MENYRAEYEKWLSSEKVDDETKAELKSLGDGEIKARFSEYMEFGTAGLRAEMRAGNSGMNTYTVAHATAGLGELIISLGDKAKRRGVAVAYDSRNNYAVFARRSAEVLSAMGIKSYLFESLRPTPVLSFAVRELDCIAGINITASHNPKEYNGYKAYFEDGAQLSPEDADAVAASMAKTDIFDDVPSPSEADESLIIEIGKELDEKYIEKVMEQAVNPKAIPSVADEMKIVYTPLHGAGCRLVPEVLRRAGVIHLFPVESQMKPDGNFPTVVLPNPEFPAAFEEGIKVAERENSDLIIATDPDADRVGVMARDKSGNFRCITGNQMGALLLDYIITAYKKNGTMPPEPYAVKSIVSSEMATEICRAGGVEMFNVLTGFKFIGEVIKNHEASGHGTFLLGFEESYGYLKGTYARDKDAVVASLLIAEMAAFYKERGKTLSDALDELFEKYGYFKESVENIAMKGMDGKEKMARLMRTLRESPLSEIDGKKVAEYRDYQSGVITNNETGETSSTGLPSSNVLYYVTSAGDVVVIRPSGTEPKVKIYVLTKGKDEKSAVLSAEGCLKSIKAIVAEIIE